VRLDDLPGVLSDWPDVDSACPGVQIHLAPVQTHLYRVLYQTCLVSILVVPVLILHALRNTPDKISDVKNTTVNMLFTLIAMPP